MTSRTNNDTSVSHDGKRLRVVFFRTSADAEPVRSWLLSLTPQDRKIVGADIKAVEFGWPIGLPLCKPMSGRSGLWEVRSDLTGGRIARVLFCIRGSTMVLLHGFEKKSQKTLPADLDLAERRMRGLSR